MTPVILPQYGNSVESCVIVAWRKAVGETVRAGEVIAEVETDKAIMEVESPADGVLTALLASVGQDVPVKTAIAELDGPADAMLRVPTNGPTDGGATVVGTHNDASVGTDGVASRPRISPRARRLAAASGFDAGGLTGSGPRGRIIERDVQAAIAARGDLPSPTKRSGVGEGPGMGVAVLTPSPDPSPTPLRSVGEGNAPPREIGNARVRRRIAARMRESLATTAQFTLHARADARALRRYRAALKDSPAHLGVRGVTIGDLVLFAVARTLVRFPDLNAHFVDGAVHPFPQIDLGVAVDSPRGLLVPVVHDAGSLTLRALSDRAGALARAAADGSIAPDDLHGGTFTVSNLGAMGIDTFTPILNPPQVAILGVGGISLQPVEGANGVEFVPMIALSLTLDHQAIDGAPGARFLAALGESLAAIDLLSAG